MYSCLPPSTSFCPGIHLYPFPVRRGLINTPPHNLPSIHLHGQIWAIWGNPLHPNTPHGRVLAFGLVTPAKPSRQLAEAALDGTHTRFRIRGQITHSCAHSISTHPISTMATARRWSSVLSSMMHCVYTVAVSTLLRVFDRVIAIVPIFPLQGSRNPSCSNPLVSRQQKSVPVQPSCLDAHLVLVHRLYQLRLPSPIMDCHLSPLPTQCPTRRRHERHVQRHVHDGAYARRLAYRVDNTWVK